MIRSRDDLWEDCVVLLNDGTEAVVMRNDDDFEDNVIVNINGRLRSVLATEPMNIHKHDLWVESIVYDDPIDAEDDDSDNVERNFEDIEEFENSLFYEIELIAD